MPANPEAWLLTVARRKLGQARRHGGVATAAVPTLQLLREEQAAVEAPDFPDERLKLLLVCAHPAIEPGMRAPLMLQTVLGLDAARIGSAFLVAPATMGQRLVRAKARIKSLGLRFEPPEPRDLPARLDAVLDAVYAAYGSGWDDQAGADARATGLAGEALWLARLLTDLLPDEPEAKGLLALILHCEARRPARRDGDGRFVPLDAQDASLWSASLIREAEAALRAAAALGRPGRFQLEAAIQSAHVQGRLTGESPWDGIALLYEGLVRLAPTMGARIGRAAALAQARGPASGLALLAAIPGEAAAAYQPYWALKADLHRRLGEREAAAQAYARAAGLAEDPAVRAFLLERKAAL